MITTAASAIKNQNKVKSENIPTIVKSEFYHFCFFKLHLRMKLNIKLYICILYLAALVNVGLAIVKQWESNKRSSRRNQTSKLKHRRKNLFEFTTTTTTTTKEPIQFPYPMLCISKKAHRAVAEEVTERCCRTVGVACKQREHIGQPTQWDCVTETPEQMKGMIKCCNKKKKTWKKGKVTGGIDCNHKNHQQDTQ